ncbi:MAG: hypothetical protein AYK18_07245 [Theionarchaea archaeon DG-70]|nr:MAG: hypothetical protein AYK18_07245 [Theionarchaea archaeon DG-70]
MTAVKLRIQDLVEGTFDGKCIHITSGTVSEARVLGTLIDVFTTDDDSYISLTLDDGTETVRIKAWGPEVQKLKVFSKGDLIDVVGKVREYNEEIYLTSEVIFKVSPNKWILRELELMKSYVESGAASRDTLTDASGKERVPPEAEIEEPQAEAPAAERKETEETKERKEEESVPGEKRKEETEKIELEEKEDQEEKGGFEKLEEEVDFDEIGEFEILGEDEVVETVLDFLRDGLTKQALIEQSGLDEIDVELALRELLDEKKIVKEGDTYKRIA